MSFQTHPSLLQTGREDPLQRRAYLDPAFCHLAQEFPAQIFVTGDSGGIQDQQHFDLPAVFCFQEQVQARSL